MTEKAQIEPAGKTKRIEYLDAIRGIAAMMVVFYHYLGWHWPEERAFHVAACFFNGSDAVSFFFVLSGFVLSYKYIHTSAAVNIKKFTFNRILRLYPAFIITVLLNYLYWNRHDLGLHLIKQVFWDFHLPLWAELVMVKGQHMYYIPGWTLGVEMALSMLMPVLTIAATKNIKLIIWLIPISILIGPGYVSIFTMHFCLGILLAYYYPQIRDYDFKASKYYAYRWLIGIAVFILFSLRHIERMHGFGSVYAKLASFFRIDIFHYTGFASFMILLFVINNKRTQKWLSGKVLHFIGKISYSIYLMHWLVVVAIMERWKWHVKFFGTTEIAYVVMLFVAIAATLLLATMMYYWVEKPFIKLSKRISRRF